jgi:hypothetical protein
MGALFYLLSPVFRILSPVFFPPHFACADASR